MSPLIHFMTKLSKYRRAWPLWILATTLLILLSLAYLYWTNPELLDIVSLLTSYSGFRLDEVCGEPPTPTSRSGPEGIIWGAQEWI
jgi:hypothetical protein